MDQEQRVPGLDERASIDIIVPVYNATADVEKCVSSVLANTAGNYRLILIDDASPEASIFALFTNLEKKNLPQLVLLRNEHNLGFTGTANRGMQYSQRDVVLLNSDTIVTQGWLDALCRCAQSDTRIGTATPFSNNAEICSYPTFCVNEAWQEGRDPEPIRAALASAAVPSYPEIPTGVGFCLYIKRAVLDRVGFFDQAFGAGYGEENDFCLRAQKSGFRNVLCDDAFVVHTGGRSFAGRKTELSERNMPLLLAKHPEYLADVQGYIARDPLRPIREMAQIEERKTRFAKRTVLHIVHAHGGGTESHARTLIANAPQDWSHYLVIANGDEWRVELAQPTSATIVAPSPVIVCVRRREDEAWDAFIGGLCATLGVSLIHVHNLSACREGILSTLPVLKLPYGYSIHDLSFACPTITLLDAQERYCGGQIDVEICGRCLRQQKAFSEIAIVNWRDQHRAFVAGAHFLIAPSRWAAAMFERYFKGVTPQVIAHGSQQESRSPHALSALVFPDDGVPVVAVLGAVGPDKGARRLERLVELARTQDAAIRFVLIGYLDRQHGPWQSEDGRLSVHGRYDPRDLVTLMDHYRAHLVLYPSAGPETFSYTLSETWQAGRPALVPPFGALAERMQQSDAGWVMREEEWADESLMLQRLLDIFAAPQQDEFKRKEANARVANLPTVEMMAEETSMLYKKVLDAYSSAPDLASFPPVRIRDALGYRAWAPQCSQATPAEARPGALIKFVLWGVRFKQTYLGRVLYALVPKRMLEKFKQSVFQDS